MLVGTKNLFLTFKHSNNSNDLNFLRNFFLPTEVNRGTPYGLSLRAFFAYLLVAVFIFFSFYFRSLPLASLVEPFLTFSPQEISLLLNQERTEAGLQALRENPVLARAAEKKLNDMLSRQYFSHRTPEGKEPWAFLENEGYKFSAAGENLAGNFTSARQAHEALMASPSHRANILNRVFREVGIAVRGSEFEGYPSVMVVQFFGSPGTQPPSIWRETGEVAFQELKVLSPASPSSGSVSSPKPQVLQKPQIKIKTPMTAVPTDASPAPEVAGRLLISYRPDDMGFRIIILAILFLILLPFLFLLLQKGFNPRNSELSLLQARTLALLIFFGYLAFAETALPGSAIDSFAASYVADLQTEKLRP